MRVIVKNDVYFVSRVMGHLHVRRQVIPMSSRVKPYWREVAPGGATFKRVVAEYHKQQGAR